LSIVGVVVLAIGIGVIATQSYSKVDGFQRVSFAQRTGSVTFGSAGDYVAYYEARGVDNSITTVPAILLELRNHQSGDVVTLVPYGNNPSGKLDKLTYNYNGHNGVAYREFHIATTGAYDVLVRGGAGVDQSGDVAFGQSIQTGTLLGGGLVLVGILLLVAGLIVLIVGLVRRRGHKNELLRYAYGGPGYPPPPGYGGYPPQGYPPPGYAPPGYAPPGQPQQPPTSLQKNDPPDNPWPPSPGN
jgi:hypothetical protein